MKIYFTASSRGTSDFDKYFKQIYNFISSHNHKHTSDYASESDPTEIYSSTQEDHVKLYKRAMNQMKKSDIVILEVSTHSLTMGYLIESSLSLGKPVVALYLSGNKPAFAAGISNDRFQLVEYNQGNIEDLLVDALDYASSQQDTRFNFFVAPKHINFLDWVAKNKKIPRSVFLRRLIEREIANDEQYSK
jgi:hypothetical protein